ncbi:MAG: hypothetical protein JNL70_18645 [Saprospiraceae bacterium]|nr:hypothetical protein [Saprospiraceae bacterium]
MSKGILKWIAALGLSVMAIGFVWSKFMKEEKATQQTYDVVFTSSASHDLNPLFEGSPIFKSDKQEVKIDFKSKLNKTTVKTTDSLDWVVFGFDTPQLGMVVNGDVLTGVDMDGFKEDLKKPMLAKIDKTGKIIAVASDSSISPTIDILFRNVISQMQVVFPKNTPSVPNQWATLEEEPMGQFKGRMTLDKAQNDTTLSLVKEKAGYTFVSGDYGNFGKPAASGSYNATIQIRKKDNVLTNIDVDDLKKLSFGKDTTAQSHITFKAKFVQETTLVEGVSHFLDYFTHKNYVLWGRLDSDPAWEKIKIIKCTNILGKETVESLMDSLKTVNISAKKWDDGLFQKIQALIYLQPKSAKELAQLLEGFTPKTLAFSIIVNALGLEEKTEVQQVFTQVIKKYEQNPEAMFEILPMVSSMKHPSVAVENAVRALAFESKEMDIASTAQLAYASIAYRTKAEAPQRSENIVETIVSQFKNRVNAQQYILMLGNTGSDRALEEIKPFLSDAKNETRGTALSNLRLINQPAVDSILYIFATKDTSNAIKKVALETLEFRSTQTVY